ncbi:MAG: ABC transporter substrate-binding protein [Coriobacteriia bacterium]|nr:ABC transporter substrate-binding protein [Coriobacteriia bacterium]
MSTTHSMPAMNRRTFIGGALATGAMLAMAGRGATAALADEATANAVQGGDLKYYLTNPVGIEPFSAEENQGISVIYNTFDPLCTYDWEKGEIVPLAAESWDVNDDATQFTFHLRQGATFHNGNPVTSKDFKYSWERLCKSDFKPSPSTLGYKLSQVKGADEMMKGEATELDVECPDDYTFVVNLKAPFADFPSIAAEVAAAPVPAGSTDTEEDFQKFRVAPIGNGPFMMDGEWVDSQYIKIKRYDGYWGEKPFIDSVTFSIYTDDQTAWTEFMAGNLDFTIIPSGQFQTATTMYGTADGDGLLANPGKQTFNGDESSIYYMLCNNKDDVMKDPNVRIAISYAMNRQAMCDSIFQGFRAPASNILVPGVPGFEDGAWDFCPPEGDKDKAAEYFDKAGYTLGADGKRGLSMTLSCNSGASNEDIMTMVQADLAACGVDATVDVQEWAAYIDAVQGGTYQIGRMGWVIQVPYADGLLQPLLYTGSGDNNSQYSNPDFDAAIDKARTIVDDEERIKAYQEANKIAAADFPVIPMFYYKHTYVASGRVNNMYLNPATYARLTQCWLTA